MKKFSILLLLLAPSFLFAQKAETPQHEYDLGGKIEFMRLTQSGVLVVGGSNGFAGIKPGASSTHFNFTEYGKIKEEEIEFIPMSPYAIIYQNQKKISFTGNSKRTVIDLVSGKILFATEENGWTMVAESKIFLPQNKLVIVGNRNKKENGVLAAGIYDLETGKQEGFVNLDPGADKKTRSMASIPESSGAPFLSGSRLYVPTTKQVICADITNGNILWEAKIKNITSMEADESGKEIYGFEEREKDTRIHKFSSNGDPLWAKERKVKGMIENFNILPQGIAVVSNVAAYTGSNKLSQLTAAKAESKISFLDAADGTDLWEKAPKTGGYVQHFYIVEDGILFGIGSSGINKISFDGKPLFKKPLSTGVDIKTMAMTPKGMIYITNTDANIINLSTGESVWNKPIKYKKADAVSDAYDAVNNRYLISTGKEVISIDENTGDVSTLATVKFDGKEVANALEVRGGGVFLSSDQNMALLDFGGKEKFHKFYQAPGKSAAGAILAGIGTVASVAASATMTIAAQNNRKVNFAGTNMATIGDYTETGKAYLNAARNFEKIASQSFREMTKRFSATAATENAQFILTKVDGDVGLVKLNKDTGDKEKEIVLKDKKPVYEVDELGGYLYYQANGNTIYSYNLNQ